MSRRDRKKIGKKSYFSKLNRFSRNPSDVSEDKDITSGGIASDSYGEDGAKDLLYLLNDFDSNDVEMDLDLDLLFGNSIIKDSLKDSSGCEKISYEEEIDEFVRKKQGEEAVVHKKTSSDSSPSIYYRNGMITADKIISLEDEKVYAEKMEKRRKMGMDPDIKVMTVSDIKTVEDELKKTADICKKGDTAVAQPSKEKPVSKDSEKSIYDIKRLEIEKAPFDEEVRLAKIKLRAEKRLKEKKNSTGME